MVRLLIFFSAWFVPLMLLYSDPRMLGVRWKEVHGFPADVRALQLASSWRLFKHSAFTIACSPSRQLHLVLKARTPGPREYVRLGDSDLSVFVNGNLDELEVSGRMVEVGQVDTSVTSALTRRQLDRLVVLFGDSDPGKVSVGIGSEYMVFMSGDADGADIREFATGC